MESRSFVYWLQGFYELSGLPLGAPLTGEQSDSIRRHLALVFKHEIDPSAGGPEHQSELDAIHGGAAEDIQQALKAAAEKLTKAGTAIRPPHDDRIVYRC